MVLCPLFHHLFLFCLWRTHFLKSLVNNHCPCVTIPLFPCLFVLRETLYPISPTKEQSTAHVLNKNSCYLLILIYMYLLTSNSCVFLSCDVTIYQFQPQHSANNKGQMKVTLSCSVWVPDFDFFICWSVGFLYYCMCMF